MTSRVECDVTMFSVCVVHLIRVYWLGWPCSHINAYKSRPSPCLQNLNLGYRVTNNSDDTTFIVIIAARKHV